MFRAAFPSVFIAAVLSSAAAAEPRQPAIVLSPQEVAQYTARIEQIDRLLLNRTTAAKRYAKPLPVRSTQFWARFGDPTAPSTTVRSVAYAPVTPAAPGRFSTSATDALEAAKMQDTRPALTERSIAQLRVERRMLAALLAQSQ